MSVHRITEEQYHDRIEWLSGAAGLELQQAIKDHVVGYGAEIRVKDVYRERLTRAERERDAALAKIERLTAEANFWANR